VTAIFIGLITFVAGPQYSGGSFHVGDGQGTRHRGATFDGSSAGTDPADFSVTGTGNWSIGAQYSDGFRIRVRLDCGNLSADSADPQVYAVPYVPFHPNFLDGLWIASAAMSIAIVAIAAAGAGGGPVVAGGNPAV